MIAFSGLEIFTEVSSSLCSAHAWQDASDSRHHVQFPALWMPYGLFDNCTIIAKIDHMNFEGIILFDLYLN